MRVALPDSPDALTWHEDVMMFRVWDTKTTDIAFLGYLYYDVYKREGKTNKTVCYSLAKVCQHCDTRVISAHRRRILTHTRVLKSRMETEDILPPPSCSTSTSQRRISHVCYQASIFYPYSTKPVMRSITSCPKPSTVDSVGPASAEISSKFHLPSSRGS